MTTNWGDIVINEMANRDENRIREARYLAQANQCPPTEPKHPFAGLAQALRHQFGKAHTADHTDANRNMEPRQKPA